ncbi:mucin-5B isoform X1 [Takifugu rubripes]|uniref:Mucin-5B-like n=1 Tax=Takifugu rubripes TaxID=31033 RepID=A0A674NL92_TAKRU|nr:mucin-5B-like isoform X1 [Takifugu rubripes]
MVSKEPNHLLPGQTNGKSTLSDKLPGTMTVRSVLLNRDSPDIESRLKRRRNRTHQVRFKDLEDGSSSSGNSGTGDNNSNHKPVTDVSSPHALRKHGNRSQPWTDVDGPRASGLPGQTSVVGAVRGDMASTIEVVAAFLARAPPHPLTPGPTRRCWAPPQSSLTLPMTRRSNTSTSTAIQTSPRLKKTQPFSSTHARSQSLGDSVGVEGDDEHDSQDEYLTHNHVLLPCSKDHSGSPVTTGDRTVVERRSKSCRTDQKSAVSSLKSSRHSCPPSVLHSTEPCHCSSVPCRDGPKRQGSSTPSVLRRRKRLNRTTSDPGKEVHYCTTVTQTESPKPSLQPSNTKLCTIQVQTESHSTSLNSKYCTAQSQTERHSPPVIEKHCTMENEVANSCPTLPPTADQHTMEIQTESPRHIIAPTCDQPCAPRSQTSSPCPSPPLPFTAPSVHNQTQSCASPSIIEDPPDAQITTVPYCSSPPPAAPLTQTPDQCSKASRSSPAKPACTTPPPPPVLLTIPCSTSASNTIQQPVPYLPVVSSTATPSAMVDSACPSTAESSNSTTGSSPVTNTDSSPPVACSTTSKTPTTASVEPTIDTITALNETQQVQHNTSSITPPTNPSPLTFATQTTLSCTSISYYSTTHPIGAIGSTAPSYATVIQTVSHCNIPCKYLQNASAANTGINPYSSPVPRIKSCTSPPPLVKTYAPTLANAKSSATPTKAVPPYSSTFRAAPPYTPPSQAPHNAQDKRGIRLPPPPPPPPPYTPRKKGNGPSGTAIRTTVLRADSKASKTDKDTEAKKEDVKCPASPKVCEIASSMKHRAQSPPVAVIKGEKQSSSPAKACFKPSCLSSAQAQLGVLHKMLCSGASARPNTPNSQCLLLPNTQGCSGAKGCSASGEQPSARPLTASQADTLRQVQEILGGLVSGARCKLDPSRVTEKLLGPNGPLHDIRSLQNQLQSLEGVLETSQNTIKVLLDVIQDLEKKEAERDGRHSYRTGQDIENCGTCRDCACIIYSVEHDFRLQEGQVVRTWKVGDPPEGMPQPATPQCSTPSQQDSPQPVRPPAAVTKKNRKKCFWFL